MLLAHGWALKHGYFGPLYTLDSYIGLQTRHVHKSLIPHDRREDYPRLLG